MRPWRRVSWRARAEKERRRTAVAVPVPLRDDSDGGPTLFVRRASLDNVLVCVLGRRLSETPLLVELVEVIEFERVTAGGTLCRSGEDMGWAIPSGPSRLHPATRTTTAPRLRRASISHHTPAARRHAVSGRRQIALHPLAMSELLSSLAKTVSSCTSPLPSLSVLLLKYHSQTLQRTKACFPNGSSSWRSLPSSTQSRTLPP